MIFTGGIGENVDEVRRECCEGLEFMGLKIDRDANKAANGKEAKFSAADSHAEAWVIPTNEELLIARDTKEIVEKMA